VGRESEQAHTSAPACCRRGQEPRRWTCDVHSGFICCMERADGRHYEFDLAGAWPCTKGFFDESDWYFLSGTRLIIGRETAKLILYSEKNSKYVS
jgi:hypothetical protein